MYFFSPSYAKDSDFFISCQCDTFPFPPFMYFAVGVIGKCQQCAAVSDAAPLCADNRLSQVAAASDVDTGVRPDGPVYATELLDVLAPDDGQLNVCLRSFLLYTIISLVYLCVSSPLSR